MRETKTTCTVSELVRQELNSGQQCIDCPYAGRRNLKKNTKKTKSEDRDISGQVGMEMRA